MASSKNTNSSSSPKNTPGAQGSDEQPKVLSALSQQQIAPSAGVSTALPPVDASPVLQATAQNKPAESCAGGSLLSSSVPPTASALQRLDEKEVFGSIIQTIEKDGGLKEAGVVNQPTKIFKETTPVDSDKGPIAIKTAIETQEEQERKRAEKERRRAEKEEKRRAEKKAEKKAKKAMKEAASEADKLKKKKVAVDEAPRISKDDNAKDTSADPIKPTTFIVEGPNGEFVTGADNFLERQRQQAEKRIAVSGTKEEIVEMEKMLFQQRKAAEAARLEELKAKAQESTTSAETSKAVTSRRNSKRFRGNGEGAR